MQPIASSERLNHLQGFAGFIINNHYEEFLTVSYRFLKELDVPLLDALPGSEAEALANKSNLELLTSLVEMNPAAHIQQAVDRWRDSQFPKVKRNQMVVEDVTRIAHARKLSFLEFLPRYTRDVSLMMSIVAEIDAYILQYTSTTLHSFVSIMDERLEQHVERLEMSEALYKQAEAIAHIGHWSWEIATNKVSWTDELYRIFGMEPRAEGISYEEYLSHGHPDDRPLMVSKVEEALSTRKPMEYFHRIVTSAGGTKYLHARGEVKLDANGVVIGMIGTGQDVTALKEAELKLVENQQMLLHRTQALQESNESLEEFAFVASHDLKEPLRKISTFLGRLESLSRKGTEDEQLYFGKVLSSSVRMTLLIDDLLTLAVISEEKPPLPCSLEEILQDTLQVFEEQIRKTNTVVESSSLPVAPVVASQFNRLFQNLIGNSIKFAKKETDPRISISHRFYSKNDLDVKGLQPAERYLELTFTDNGIGFNSAYVEKIFSVFQRLHSKEEYEGTGIGLAICRKIVRNHGGLIVGYGEPGQGAKFVITIPA